MKIVCTNCGKEIKNWEKAYFFLELPERGITEIKSYLKNNAQAYCLNCATLTLKPNK